MARGFNRHAELIQNPKFLHKSIRCYFPKSKTNPSIVASVAKNIPY
jgi:hypothetical protein